MELSKNNCILMGLPGSGKSTFLSAVWHVAESAEVSDAIKVIALPENREYLNNMRNTWLGCKDLERNKAESVKPISLSVENPLNGSMGVFNVPDLAGEMYELQFESRKLGKDFVDMVKVAHGIVLFIDPDTLKKPVHIADVQKVLQPQKSAESVKKEAASDTKPWKHKEAPTQVALVDLLQVFSDFLVNKIKIAIVVSAWDLIIESPDEEYAKLNPEEWLQKELPLLWQFLENNNNVFNKSIYGISAQGGQYGKDNSKLQNFGKPSERIKVQIGNSTPSHDITLPFKWLLDEG